MESRSRRNTDSYILNPWLFSNKPIDEEILKTYYGFVYLITDLETGRLYIGKKNLWSIRKVKGKSRRQRKESNWKNYYSSNDEIRKLAKDNPNRFRREILHLCKTQGETNYYEVYEQFVRNVLQEDIYINDNINGKYFKANVKNYHRPTKNMVSTN